MRSILLAALLVAGAAPAAAQTSSLLLSQTDVGLAADRSVDYDWNIQARIGDDVRRLWLKSEADLGAGPADRADVQALGARTLGDFWDVELGVRQTIEPAARTHLAAGVQGLAPYWFDVEATAFLDTHGRASAIAAIRYELTLSQRIFAEPYGAVRLAATSAPRLLEGAGVTDVEGGVRLRYEISRKFAPYVGVGWTHRFGKTARLWSAAGGDADETTLRLGLRLLR